MSKKNKRNGKEKFIKIAMYENLMRNPCPVLHSTIKNIYKLIALRQSKRVTKAATTERNFFFSVKAGT